MSSPPLHRALTESREPALALLPTDVSDLLTSLNAPPRLGAHLRAVHDVTIQLTAMLHAHHPRLRFDRASVLYGAATHDIGKVIHVSELSEPGSDHEEAGYALLLSRGVSEPMARFARDHASWNRPDIRIEDLLVSLADKVWKAKRVTELENLVVARLAAADGVEAWEAFLSLDDILDRLAAGADHRLAYQASHGLLGSA